MVYYILLYNVAVKATTIVKAGGIYSYQGVTEG
jgi:hypothetical protein